MAQQTEFIPILNNESKTHTTDLETQLALRSLKTPSQPIYMKDIVKPKVVYADVTPFLSARSSVSARKYRCLDPHWSNFTSLRTQNQWIAMNFFARMIPRLTCFGRSILRPGRGRMKIMWYDGGKGKAEIWSCSRFQRSFESGERHRSISCSNFEPRAFFASWRLKRRSDGGRLNSSTNLVVSARIRRVWAGGYVVRKCTCGYPE